jgi:gluconokinase
LSEKTKHRVQMSRAVDPFVLALDVGSTASRGDVYDATGRPVEGGRQKVAHQFRTAGDGTSEIDPDTVVEELGQIIDGLATKERQGRIGGVALDTFASSLVGVSTDGSAVTPCYTYADTRCAPQAMALRRELNEAEVHQRTGCRLHTSYLAPRLRWLRETNPDQFAAAARWMSLGEYAYLKLLGTTAAGTSTAAWTGLLDRRSGAWDPQMLTAAGVESDQLSAVRNPDQPLTDVDQRGSHRWPALADVSWFPPIADGFASNLGTGADKPTSAALAAATSGAMRVLVDEIPDSFPSGLWCYRVDARRSLIGGAINDVGRTVAWLQATLQLGETDLNELMAAAPDRVTPLVMPYFTGERAPGWATDARAVFTRISAATTGPLMFRGGMEGVALTYARVAAALQTTAANPQRILASGRVTQDLPGWLQVLADVLNAVVEPVTIKRATLHGTALHALEVLTPTTPPAPTPTGGALHPLPQHRSYYQERATEYERLYAALNEPDRVAAPAL